MQRCPFCGSEDLIHSAARGDTVCGNPACGEILEEKAMVAEQGFVTTSSGSIAAAGQRVMWSGIGNYCAGAAHSQEITISRGVTKIRWIADRLSLNSQIQEAGRRMYQLAVQMNFTTGRATKYIACACLYMVCRRNKSPHLLIDFSDVVQTPVKVLGQVYMRLLKRLVGGHPEHQQAISDGVTVPLIDPSIFIERYARKLELGGMQRKVQNTAMRVIKFMHRDWICTGRRPNGLCGAALLISSFYHGVNCPAGHIADVVRMTEGTLKIRLVEMRQTPMALMSRAQFEQADPDAEAIEDEKRPKPPCMLRRLKRVAFAQLDDREKLPELTDKENKAMALTDSTTTDEMQAPAVQDGSAGQTQSDRSADIGKKRKRELPPVPPMHPDVGAVSSSASAAPSGKDDQGAKVQEDVVSAAASTQNVAASGGQQDSAAKHVLLEPSGNDIEEIASEITNKLLIDKDAPLQEGGSGEASRDWQMTASLSAGRIEQLHKEGPGFDDLPLTPHDSSSVDGTASESGTVSVRHRNEEPLDDIDDMELEAYLLNEEEQQHKANIWHEVNKDYLQEWHERSKEKKRRMQQREADSKNDSTSETGSRTSSRRSSGRRSNLAPSDSATTSTLMALTKKAKVKPERINIAALESLFADS